MRFVHLNVHSNYSFCRGASRLEELVVAARRRGMDTMALTDTNGLHGLIWFLDAAKAAGLRPIVGAEIDLRALAQRAEFSVEEVGNPWMIPGSGEIDALAARGSSGEDCADHLAECRAWGRAVVIVKDTEGYAGLCRLLSSLHHGGDWPPPEDPEEEREAARQRGVVERVAGYTLRRKQHRASGSDAGGRDAGEASPQDLPPARGPARFSRGARVESGGKKGEGTKRNRPLLTRSWLAEELARLRGCIILSADAGLLAHVMGLRRTDGCSAPARRSGEDHAGRSRPFSVSSGEGSDAKEGDRAQGTAPALAAAVDLYVELRPGVPRGALLRFARARGLPPVATGGVHFVDEAAYPLHRLLRAIDLNTCLSRLPPEELEPREATLVSPEEMARRHPDCPEAIENASRIADLCRFTLPRGAPIFPAYESLRDPGGDESNGSPIYPAYESLREPDEEESGEGNDRGSEGRASGTGPKSGSLESIVEMYGVGPVEASFHAGGENPRSAAALLDPDSLLERDGFEGAERRYGEMNEAIAERLEYELSIVREKGFAPYFLVVRDIVSRAPRTCGRGSAAASLISYALGITHVDPIRFDLFFERFLNPGRVDPPDIDVDFPWDERDDILEWVFRRYGRRRVAMISNHVTFQARAAVREIAKVFGLTDEEIGRVTKRMPWFTDDVIETTRSHPVFKDLSFPAPWPEILRLARRIDGYPRGLSVHCGGVVIVPDEIDRHVPVQPAAKGVDVVQWEKDQSEDAGLVKIDLLGNRSLAVIRDACRAIRDNGGPDIRFETFRPIDDPATQDLIRRGNTVGVFYVESPAMRQLQTKCGVGDFEHLVIHSSIIRPAANDYIREYVRRLRGGEWTPLHPLMAELLQETYGLMVYQEDVAKIAIAMAGFDAAQADGLRKILSKKNKQEGLRDYRERFFRGAALRDVDETTVKKVWNMILSFAGYSFCKPHSASYALVSFKSAYLRTHHPAEFMAAVISNGGGYYSAFAYISECRRMGLRVLLPDINESRREYTGRTFGSPGGHEKAPSSDPRQSQEEPKPRGVVRVGLMQLQGFPDAGIDAILDERERRGPFESFEDFLERCGDDLGPAAIRVLIRSGAFDSLLGQTRSVRTQAPVLALPQYRGDLFWRLAAWERSRMKKGRARTRSLLPPLEAGPLPGSKAYDERTALGQEIEALGFLISRHPLSFFSGLLARANPVRGCDLAKHVGRVVRIVGWYVTAKTVMTRHGEPMEFLSFEDTTALYETTFFPRTYARFCHMMTKVRPYLLTGRVEEDFGAVSLNVSDVRFLDATAADREEAPPRIPAVLTGPSHNAEPERPSHVGGTSPHSEAWRRSRE